MSRTKFFSLVLVIVMLFTVGSASFAQGTTLVVWADGERAPLLNDLADDVEAQLGVTLDVQEVSFGDIRDQLLVAGPVGEGPDVFIGAHDWLGQMVTNGAVVPLELSDDERGLFEESALNLFTFNGDLYGIPYAIENIALVRNVDLVPDAPTTWEEVTTIAEGFADNDVEGDYAFLVQTGDAYHAFPIFSAFGGYVFGVNEDGTFNPGDVGLASEGGLAAAEWMEDMYANEYMVTSVDNDVAFSLFEDGQLGMFVTGPWFSQRISETGINYAIDPLPGSTMMEGAGAPFSGGQGFMISGFSDNQLLAEIFLLDYVVSEDFMQAIFDQGKRPPAFSAVDTSADPNIANFLVAGANAVPMPAIPEMGAVWSAAGNAQTLVSQGEPAVETYQNAVMQINEAIGLINSEERIVGLPGSLQAAVGCDNDWDPACEVTFLSDEDGDGIYNITLDIPAGSYEFKVAMNGSWDENYGVDGAAGGDNLLLELEEDSTVTFTYDDSTNIVTYEVE